jgi:secreted protein with Ig-like and vWFA domain
MNEPSDHDSLRDLVHQSLVSDKLSPSAELRSAVEQKLDEETLVSPAPPMPEKEHRRLVRPWHMALLLTAALAVMVYLSLPEQWRFGYVASNGWTSYPASNMASVNQKETANAKAYAHIEGDPATTRAMVDYDAMMKAHDAAQAEESKGLSTLPSYLAGANTSRSKSLGDETASKDGLGEGRGFGSRPDIEVDPRIGDPVTSNAPQMTGAIPGNGLAGRGAPAKGKSSTQGGQAAPGFFRNQAAGGVAISGGPNGNAGGEQGAGQGASTQPQASVAGEPSPQSIANAPVVDRLVSQAEGIDGYSTAFRYTERELAAAKNELAVEQAARRAALATLRAKLALEQQTPGSIPASELRRLTVLVEQESAEATAPGTEQYDAIYDNPFLPVKDAPLSTFSIDVDTASYANVRRFLTQGQLPPRDAVRIEELLNYFSYDYPAPKGDEPFSVNMETAPCPWQAEHLLLRVGLKGKDVHRHERPASNLVFLVDTSGSMSDEDKLPLVKQSLAMLTRELGGRDKITVVTYAGEAGLKLAPTGGDDKATILSTLDSLHSGGSTHGSAGIQLAYEKAREQFIKEGTNRVILCTDGDLNVGVTRDEELVELITKEAKSGVFLTVLGFGQGNLKDSKMEKLADHGNGLYAYIDGVREAKKVLVEQMSGSLTTIAKDVKIQIEFNPSQVRGYRLIGYENRVLAAKDFNDDTKDAGEIGAGHTVTALYELVPAGAPEAKSPVVDDLKYQKRAASVSDRSLEGAGGQAGVGAGEKDKESKESKELLTLKLRFKQPDGDVSKKIEYPLAEKGTRFTQASADFRFAASVAAFGMILRDSPHRGAITMAGAGEIAASSLGEDTQGYRAEFLDLVRRAEKLGKK